MAIEFTRELYNDIVDQVEAENFTGAVDIISELHPYDVAQVVEGIDARHIPMLFDLLDHELSANVLPELDDSLRIKFMETFSKEQIYTKFLSSMDSDDAADLVNELPNELRRSITEYLRSTIKEDAADIIALLKYDENMAGSLMAKELVRVNLNWTVARCVEEIRLLADEVETVYAVYVVDDADKLMGLVTLRQLIISKTDAVIGDFYEQEIVSVSDTSAAEDAADVMDKYDLVAIPVVDYLGRLLGRITIDDVVDFIREEAEEDYQLASGLSENVEYSDTIWVLSRARLPWLFLGLIGGIASSKVIGLYEADIKIYPEMALFMPLILAMGGNAGVQSSAIVVQSIASKSLMSSSLWNKLSKEFFVSVINGALCAAALLTYGTIAKESWQLTVTISTALFTVIIIASVLGALIPLMLNSLKIDPALATGPFITTTNDLLGLGLYFFIGSLMYG